MTMTSDPLQQWTDLTQKAAALLDPKTHVEQFYQQNTRPDGRLFSQARQTQILPGILSKHAAGSAQVTLSATTASNNTTSTTSSNSNSITNKNNSTVVLAAVTLQVGQPTTSPDCPAGQGDVIVASVQDHCNSDANTSVLQSFLQRILDVTVDAAVTASTTSTASSDNNNSNSESSKSIKNTYQQQQQKQQQQHVLVLIPGQAALRLVVTVQIVQDGGNVTDAAVLACVAALLNAQLPAELSSQPDGTTTGSTLRLDKSNKCKMISLELPILPIPLTVGLWKQKKSQNKNSDNASDEWIVDPNHEEETVLQDHVLWTVIVNGNNSNNNNNNAKNSHHQVLCLDGVGPVSPTQLAVVAGPMAAGRAQELVPVLLACRPS